MPWPAWGQDTSGQGRVSQTQLPSSHTQSPQGSGSSKHSVVSPERCKNVCMKIKSGKKICYTGTDYGCVSGIIIATNSNMNVKNTFSKKKIISFLRVIWKTGLDSTFVCMHTKYCTIRLNSTMTHSLVHYTGKDQALDLKTCFWKCYYGLMMISKIHFFLLKQSLTPRFMVPLRKDSLTSPLARLITMGLQI